LGTDPYQRVCLRYWLLTSRLYLILTGLQFLGMAWGMIEPIYAYLMFVMVVCGITLFYSAIRSGWSKRFADTAMTTHQVAFGLVVLGLEYALAPMLQGMVLTVTPLVLLFGAFTLSPKQCQQLGLFSIFTLSAGTLLGWYVRPDSTNTLRDFIMVLCCAVIFYFVADMAARLSKIRTQLHVQKNKLAEALERNNLLARRDELTGLPNRRQALETLEYEERRAERESIQPCVCLIDLDHFKKINDTHGHAAGDEVLRIFAKNAPNSLRTPDLLTRWGGEEFLIIMPQTTVESAIKVIDRLRAALDKPAVWAAHPHLRVNFSAGIAVKQVEETMEDTVARADAALYKAKNSGRNCTMTAP
jgi:diguanylate cyclase